MNLHFTLVDIVAGTILAISAIVGIWRGLMKELLAFLSMHKKLWLLPIILVMLLMGVLLVFAQGSVIAPFIYTLF